MNRRSYKILLYGYYGFGNVGDEAICSVLLKEFKEKPGTEVIITSFRPMRSNRLHDVRACSRNYSFAFIKQILTAHALIFGGGGSYGWRTFRRIFIISLLARFFGKRIIHRNVGLYFQGPGVKLLPKPPESLIKRVLLIFTFSLADEISVRDKFSERFLRMCGVKKSIKVENDLALNLEPSKHENSCELLSNYVDLSKKKLCIGVNFRTLDSATNNKLLKVVPQTLDWLIEAFDVKIIFVPFGYGSVPQRRCDDDRIIAKEIKQRMKEKANFIIIEDEHTPQDILGMFAFFDFFIGVRFHSIVFSRVAKIPALALVYDTKVECFLKQNHENITSIFIDEINEHNFKKVLQNLVASINFK